MSCVVVLSAPVDKNGFINCPKIIENKLNKQRFFSFSLEMVISYTYIHVADSSTTI